MDSQNTTTGSILQSNMVSSIIGSKGSNESFISTSDNYGGFFSGFQNISFTTWLIIFLILAFLGFNIFVYLAKGTQDISSFFTPFLEKIFGTASNVTGQVVDVSAEGAKTVVGGVAGAINTGLTSVQNVVPNNASTSVKSQPVQNTIPQPDVMANNPLNTSQSQNQQGNNDEYHANDASSSLLQNGGSTGTAGWCYIGEEKGYRTCAQVGVNDECMSGDIFPSQEICVNPNLRS
jgi:hypothetical protein